MIFRMKIVITWDSVHLADVTMVKGVWLPDLSYYSKVRSYIKKLSVLKLDRYRTFVLTFEADFAAILEISQGK